MTRLMPRDADDAVLVGRAWRPELEGPSLCVVRGGELIDITARAAPGEPLGDIETIAAATLSAAGGPRLLAPCDLQAVKACGVTFARSMVERVIEERAAGDPAAAEAVRARVAAAIGDSLRDLVPGSEQAMKVREALVAEGLWSQYLEVGIGPDAEVFSKAQPMAAVGWGAEVGIHPVSKWNNPEPEIVLAVNSRGETRGAALGNDVNLRDVEGRSALLLGKAKDNNASCAIGPFIRLFDGAYGIEEVRAAELTLTVEGADGFVLEGRSSMREISRDPLDLVAQTVGRHHQYPDGLMLFLGTAFAPIEDRDAPGQGFTHHVGDLTVIEESRLGSLLNTVRLATEAPPWTFGTAALMRNLAARGLL